MLKSNMELFHPGARARVLSLTFYRIYAEMNFSIKIFDFLQNFLFFAKIFIFEPFFGRERIFLFKIFFYCKNNKLGDK